jgi:recombination protein U
MSANGKILNKANLGRSFEELIEAANQYYFDQGEAAIIKVPTAITLLRRWDARQKRSVIDNAFPVKKGTVDFIGQWGKLPIAFEAKSTENKTSFPLKNIPDHQLAYLEAVDALGGAAWILIEFKTLGLYFRMSYARLRSFMSEQTRKSIPLDFFKEFTDPIHISNRGILDYLKDF